MSIRRFAGSVAIALLALFNPHPGYAAREPDMPQLRPGLTNIDLNYPGVGVRTFVSDKTALEARVQFERSDLAAGIRYYWYPTLSKVDRRFRPYLCLEGDYVVFKKASTKGDGFAAGSFAGIEYALSRQFAVQIDAGPEVFFIRNKDTSATGRELEFILSFGLNYYFK